jgi:hypothetical protein
MRRFSARGWPHHTRFHRRHELLTKNSASIALLAAFAAASVLAVSPAPARLFAWLDGDLLRVSAPQLSFLNGKPLERLKDGASVAFVGQVTISTAPGAVVPVARSAARFAFSYDIWEEKFSITMFGEHPGSSRSASHLSQAGAENWCLDNLGLPRSVLPVGTPFWVRLDMRVEDPRDALGVVGEPGINITRLIEVFSRPARGSQTPWMLSAGPYKADEMRHADPGRIDPTSSPAKFEIHIERKTPPV